MAIDLEKFTALSRGFTKIDLWGAGPPVPPWGKQPTVIKARKAIDVGSPHLPLVYQQGYVAPLEAHLRTVLARTGGDAEPFAAVAYEHAPNSKVLPELRRFLAVISNLYRSFLANAKRSAANVPLVTTVPPLAFFQHAGDQGPYTITSEQVQGLCGSTIGLVSLPSTYRDHPVLWASLAHETGGHDVLHADPGLLAELAGGVRAMFGGGPVQPGHQPTDTQLDGLLWSWWIDEAASDVYGILNIGPAFALSLAAFFAALTARARMDHHVPAGAFPSLRTQSGPRDQNDPRLDEHPTDILRLHLAIGVVESLTGLSTANRNAYIGALRSLSTLCAQGAQAVTLTGDVPIERDRWIRLNNFSRPLGQMQTAARQAGAFIAKAKLAALGTHGIQEIETWDDADEAVTQQIAAALKQNAPVVDQGDDAQLLAAATLALLDQPDRYAAVTNRLAEALDTSFAHDPIWGPPAPDHEFAQIRFLENGGKGARPRAAGVRPRKPRA